MMRKTLGDLEDEYTNVIKEVNEATERKRALFKTLTIERRKAKPKKVTNEPLIEKKAEERANIWYADYIRIKDLERDYLLVRKYKNKLIDTLDELHTKEGYLRKERYNVRKIRADEIKVKATVLLNEWKRKAGCKCSVLKDENA